MKVAYFRLFCRSNVSLARAIALLTVLLTAGSVQAQERIRCPVGAPGAPTAYIDSKASDVTVLTADGRRLVASKDLLLCPGDEVRTGETGRVAIRFDEKRTVVRLDGNSRMRVLAGGTGSADATLLSGVLHFLSSVRRHFEIDTPYIVAGIDGTEALIRVETARQLAIAAVREGVVGAYDRALGEDSLLSVGAGAAAFRSAGVPFQSASIDELPEPFRSLLIVSDSAVDWAVYYPPIMFVENTRSRAVREAITLLSSGDYDRAMVALHAAKNLAPEEAYSLQTVIAVARNRIGEAERWSKLALSANPRFAPAYVAASYVRQATGELDEALVQASKAAELAPDNAYVTARLAELHMIVGDRRAALRTAELSLETRRTPLALFVAGLARLAAWEYANAEQYFNEAIRIDPEAPLPRLGLGLAFVRQGKTSQGAWEIERAVAHDPKRAALRIWLGRAYFDEGLPEKAADQFEIAKEEDPEDPTSYLFSALERYAANDPIGALRDLQEAEKLGGARQVIRSERGLNEDTATRGAAIARVFDVLGFDQLAVTEGAGAADADPANPGGHRLMADAYRQRPEQDIATSSELLRSQLLSPPSKTPVQPELGETGLALLDTTGPSRVTFAEFSPLFDGDGLRVDLFGMFGTQETWSDQAAVTGLYRNVSLSVGQFHYETNGFRQNNDLTNDVFDAIATVALSPEFSLFGEYRYRKSDGGDRLLDFNFDDPMSFFPNLRSEVEREVARAGFHAQPTANSDIIGVYSWANIAGKESNLEALGGGFLNATQADSNSDAYHIQLQHIWQGDDVRTVVGGNFMHHELDLMGTAEIIPPPGFPFPVPPPVSISSDFSIEYLNGYAYVYLDIPASVTWTLGGSIIHYDDSSGRIDTTRFLPKIGVTAELNEHVTLRGAYLRNIKPDLVAEQVIEPTNVSGFNQFYDGFNGSFFDQVGGGVDVRLGTGLYFGGEAVARYWEVPQLFPSPPEGEVDEYEYRAYVYATLTDRLALAAEINHEESQSRKMIGEFNKWRATSIPVALSYFDPSGLFGSIGVEFVDHDYKLAAENGSDSFHLLNGSIGFRLPDNRGVFTVEALNLLDEDFHFQNRTRRPDISAEPRYVPERTIMARGSVRF